MPDVAIAFSPEAERLNSVSGSGKNGRVRFSSEDLSIALLEITSETTYSQDFHVSREDRTRFRIFSTEWP